MNVDDYAVGTPQLGEARSAAALESKIGTMRRAGAVDGPVDFVVVYGPNKGKTVDFLFTPIVTALQKSYALDEYHKTI